MNAMFYMNWTRQDNTKKYSFFDQLEKHLWATDIQSKNLRSTKTAQTFAEAQKQIQYILSI